MGVSSFRAEDDAAPAAASKPCNKALPPNVHLQTLQPFAARWDEPMDVVRAF